MINIRAIPSSWVNTLSDRTSLLAHVYRSFKTKQCHRGLRSGELLPYAIVYLIMTCSDDAPARRASPTKNQPYGTERQAISQ
jgi:hypothetical protein